jgi:hypothetical protein
MAGVDETLRAKNFALEEKLQESKRGSEDEKRTTF